MAKKYDKNDVKERDLKQIDYLDLILKELVKILKELKKRT